MDCLDQGNNTGSSYKHQGKIRYVKSIYEIGISCSLAHRKCRTEEEKIGEKNEYLSSFPFPDVKQSMETFHRRALYDG